MIENTDIAGAMTVKLEDIFDELPKMPVFVPGIRRAPRRNLTLGRGEIELALKNALRYIPARHHAAGVAGQAEPAQGVTDTERTDQIADLTGGAGKQTGRGVQQPGSGPVHRGHRVTHRAGDVTERYPFNPNGSANGIAALCSPDGRHLAAEVPSSLYDYTIAVDGKRG